VVIDSGSKGDVSLVHSDRPVPASARFFYYEVTLINPGKDAAIGMGLYPMAQLPQMNGMPGWYNGSYGYHSDDGNLYNFRLEGSGAEFGPSWGNTNDVAGLFWDCETGAIAFTRNGDVVGLAFRNVFGVFYPTVGLNPHGVVAINFGQAPFVFGKFMNFSNMFD
jgi:hypothetical protein